MQFSIRFRDSLMVLGGVVIGYVVGATTNNALGGATQKELELAKLLEDLDGYRLSGIYDNSLAPEDYQANMGTKAAFINIVRET